MTIYQFLTGSHDEDVIMSLTMPGETKPFTKVTKGVADYLDVSVAARTVDPDIAVIFEATTAADLPDSHGAERVCELGKGAVISFMDGRTVYDKTLYDHAVHVCEENHIAWQTKTKIAGGNDAGAIQNAGSGVRVLAVSVPCRYLHAPVSVVRISDMEACEKLAELLLLTLQDVEDTP